MNKYKKFILIVLFLPMPFIIALLIILYLYDPMQVWHKPYFRETTFFELSEHSRAQNKGIIDFYDFDSIIMGSSMMSGTSFKEAQDKLGGKWVNLSMSAAQMHDKYIVLNYALEHKKINNIMASLDWIDMVRNRDASSFDYLYDNNIFNNMKLYLNPKFVACALMWSKSAECVGDKKDYQQIRKPDSKSTLSVEEGAKEWIERDWNKEQHKKIMDSYNKSFSVRIKKVKLELHKRYLNENLFSMVEKYPTTKFDFIIPAYSRLTYIADNIIQDFYIWRSTIKYLVERSNKYPNMFIYGFDNLDYADNLGNYFDYIHHNTDMNSMQIDSIKNKQHILTIDNIDNYLDTMEKKIKDYDLEPLIKIINEYDKKHKK